MTDIATRSVVLERDLPHPPEKVWRALTQPHLLEQWLMRNDFAATVGHRFSLTADWGGIEGQVLESDPGKSLSYSWISQGLDSVVTWTLTPSTLGTLLRVEQTGFGANQVQAFAGAKAGWPRFLGRLEEVLTQGA